jgi:hypothetical protein
VSGFDVHPFAGFVREKPEWNPDLNEVSYLIEASLKEIINPKIIKQETLQIRGHELEVPFYAIHNEKIWGATAMILAEFIEIINACLPLKKGK